MEVGQDGYTVAVDGLPDAVPVEETTELVVEPVDYTAQLEGLQVQLQVVSSLLAYLVGIVVLLFALLLAVMIGRIVKHTLFKNL